MRLRQVMAMAALLVMTTGFVPLTLPERAVELPAVDPTCEADCLSRISSDPRAAGMAARCPMLCEGKRTLEVMRALAQEDAGRDIDRKPHRCGQGMVTAIVEDTICPYPETYPWVWQRRLYSREYVRGPEGVVCRRRVELWTDWPECGGSPAGPTMVVQTPPAVENR